MVGAKNAKLGPTFEWLFGALKLEASLSRRVPLERKRVEQTVCAARTNKFIRRRPMFAIRRPGWLVGAKNKRKLPAAPSLAAWPWPWPWPWRGRRRRLLAKNQSLARSLCLFA